MGILSDMVILTDMVILADMAILTDMVILTDFGYTNHGHFVNGVEVVYVNSQPDNRWTCR